MLKSISTSRILKSEEQEDPLMRLLKDQLKRFVTEESGQDIIEYALMIVLVALTVAGLTPGVDTAVSKVFSAAVSSLAL